MEKMPHSDSDLNTMSESLRSQVHSEDQILEWSEKKTPSEIILFLRDICIILWIVLLLRTYIASPFRINGSSMESSYHNNELIIVDKISYNLWLWGITKTLPERGDVVVIQPHSINWKDFFIKRIVGIPGDRISIENGYVLIKPRGAQHSTKIIEGYLNEENLGKTYPGRSSMKNSFIVPENEYFILGDNRNGSSDSRDCFYTCATDWSSHYIKRKDIVWKLWVTLWALRILESKSVLDEMSLNWNEPQKSKIFSITPRLLDTPATWMYPEIQ
jgi:signal peptidase I